MAIFAAASEGVDSTIELVKSIADHLRTGKAYMGGNSLSSIAAAAQVMPPLRIDEAAASSEYITDVCTVLQSLVAGYYMQAISLLTTINGVTVKSKLAPLNPNRKLDIDMLSLRLASEAYTFALPMKSNANRLVAEAYGDKDDPLADPITLATAHTAANKHTIEMSALSVGKLYDVTITEGTQSATIPVAIRLAAKMMPTSNVVEMLSNKSTLRHDLKERMRLVRSGELRFWRDLVLCSDLVDAHRNAAIRDKSGAYMEIMSARNDKLLAGLLERNPSMTAYSTLVVVTQDTLETVEQNLGGPITNRKIKQALFDAADIMILAVMDAGYERVTFYTHGIEATTTLPMAKLKAKEGKEDVSAIMRAFLSGQAPRL